jgi:hypothetical protein
MATDQRRTRAMSRWADSNSEEQNRQRASAPRDSNESTMSGRPISPVPPAVPESTDAVGDLEMIELQRERSRLERLAEKRRLREDIARLREEAGDVSEPVDPVSNRTSMAPTSPSLQERNDGDGEASRLRLSNKRQRSSALEVLPVVRSSIRPRAPAPYWGKSIREHRNFVHQCTITFRRTPLEHPHDADKVLYAMQYLEGEPRDMWARQETTLGEDQSTWEEFVEFLRDIIQDPVNRGISTMQRFQDAAQLPNQSVHAFATYLETLEADLPPYSDEHRRQHIFTKLKPEIRSAITNYQDIPETCAGLISLAARLEENLRRTKHATVAPRRTGEVDPEGRTIPATNSFGRGGFRIRGRGRGGGAMAPPTRPNSIPVPMGRGMNYTDEVECFLCHEKGHYSNVCPNNRGNSQSKNGQTHR